MGFGFSGFLQLSNTPTAGTSEMADATGMKNCWICEKSLKTNEPNFLYVVPTKAKSWMFPNLVSLLVSVNFSEVEHIIDPPEVKFKHRGDRWAIQTPELEL